MLSPVAVYVHIPFCPSKCGYCDFNSYAMQGEIIDRTVRSICTEIECSPWAGRPAKTIFFGGGTPTFLDANSLSLLLDAIKKVHPPIERAEITSEANPGTVDAKKFAQMKESGVNRLSLGAQSFHQADLMRLGRIHQGTEVGRAVLAAREAGFDNINLDLMFALPEQSMRAWQENLKLAMSLNPDHLSLYCLTIEPNTRYYRLYKRGMMILPEEDEQVDMYDYAIHCALMHGYHQYEISNFSKVGKQCQHNMCYWRTEEYLAYGPGAVGCFINEDGFRTRYTNFKHPEGYCSAIEDGKKLWCESEVIDATIQRFESIMLGIRLNQGISISALNLNPLVVQKLVGNGWISIKGDALSLTALGRHYCNDIALGLSN